MAVIYNDKTINVTVSDEQQGIYVRPGDSVRFNFSFSDVTTKIVDSDLVITFNGGGGSITIADFGSLALANYSDPIKIFDGEGNEVNLASLVTGEGQWLDSESPSYLIIRELSSAESSKPVGESLASAQAIVDDDMDLVEKRGDVDMGFTSESVLAGENQQNYMIRTLEYPTDVKYDFPTDYLFNNDKDKTEDMTGTLPTIVYRMKPTFNMYYGPLVNQMDPDVNFFDVEIENGGGLEEGSYLQYDPNTIDFSDSNLPFHYEGAKYPDSIFRVFHTNMKNSSALFLGGYISGLPKDVSIVSTEQAPIVATPTGMGSYQLQSSITSLSQFDITFEYPIGMEAEDAEVEIILYAYNVNTEAILYSENTLKMEFKPVYGASDLLDESSTTFVISTVPDPVKMIGTEFDDVVRGETAPLILDMGSGDDVVQGGDLNDTMNLEDGNDTAYYSLGTDFVDGGKGEDTLAYDVIDGYTLNHINVIADRGLAVELVFNEADAPESNTEFENVEILELTDKNDTLTIVDTTDMMGGLVIDGLSDTSRYYVHEDLAGVYGYTGRAGAFSGDTILTDTTKDVYLDEGGSKVSTDVTMLYYIEYVNFETFVGGTEDDTFRGAINVSMDFDGGGGDSDEDVVTYENLEDGITYDYSLDGQVDKTGGVDHIKNFETLIGGKGNDTFYAGETGSTNFVGGDGEDVLSYENSKKGVVINLGERTVGKPYNSSDPSSYTYEDSYDDTVEIIKASNQDDLFIGNNVVNMTMDGMGGDFDAVTYSGMDESIEVDFVGGTITKAAGGIDEFLNINSFTGSRAEDIFIMSASEDTIVDGFDGSDIYQIIETDIEVNVSYDDSLSSFVLTNSSMDSQAKNIETMTLTKNDDTASFDLGGTSAPVLNMDGMDGEDTVYFNVEVQSYDYSTSTSSIKTDNFEVYYFEFAKKDSDFTFSVNEEFTGEQIVLDDTNIDTAILNLSGYSGGSGSNIKIGTVDDFDFNDGTLAFTASGFTEFQLAVEDDVVAFYEDDMSFWSRDMYIYGGGGTNTITFENYAATSGAGVVVDLGKGLVSLDGSSDKSFHFFEFSSFVGTGVDDFFLLDTTSSLAVEIDGGAGTDYISYRNQTSGMVLDVNSLALSYTNIEGYETTDQSDVINMADASTSSDPDNVVKDVSGAGDLDTVNFVGFAGIDLVIDYNDTKGYIESTATSSGYDYRIIKVEKYNGTNETDNFNVAIELETIRGVLLTNLVIDGVAGSDTVTFVEQDKGIDIFFSIDGSAAVDSTGTADHALEMVNITDITMSEQDDIFYFSSTQSIIGTGITVKGGGDTSSTGTKGDTISFGQALGSININIDSTSTDTIINYGDEYTFSGFERIEGSVYDDVFVITEGVTYDLSGGAGTDTLDMSAFISGVVIDTSLGTITTNTDVINFENFTKFITGSGNDSVVINNDTKNLYIDFGTGNDTVDYSLVDKYYVNIAINDKGEVSALRDGVVIDKDVYSGVTTLSGTANDDRIVVSGGAGGIESLYGGGGVDDLVLRDFTSGLSLSYTSGGNFDVGGGHVIGGFESFLLTDYDDMVNISGDSAEVGASLGDRLEFKAGLGTDTLSYAGYTDSIKVDVVNSTVQRYNTAGDAVVAIDYYRDFEKIVGGEGNDTFILTDNATSITEIDGGAGDNDSLSYENSTGAITYAPGGGSYSGSIKVTNVEAVTLTRYDDVAEGSFSESMRVSGSSSSFSGDTLRYVGTGSETVTIDFTTMASGGYSTVVKSTGGNDYVADFENLELVDVVGDIKVSSDNTMSNLNGGGNGSVTIVSGDSNASFDLVSGNLLLDNAGRYSQKVIKSFETYNFDSSNMVVTINMTNYDAAGFKNTLYLSGVAGGSYELRFLNVTDQIDVTLDGANTKVDYTYGGESYTINAAYATRFTLGSADDTIVVSDMSASDVVYGFSGGEGNDTLDMKGYTGSVYVDLSTGYISSDSTATDVVATVYDIENFAFGDGDQTMTGFDDTIIYNVDFGAGNDTASFVSSSAIQVFEIDGSTVETSGTVLSGVENIEGSSFDDFFNITGSAFTGSLPNMDGGAGNDTFQYHDYSVYLSYNFGTGELMKSDNADMSSPTVATFTMVNVESIGITSKGSTVIVPSSAMYDGLNVFIGDVGGGGLILQGEGNSAATLSMDTLGGSGQFSFSGISGTGSYTGNNVHLSGNSKIQVNDFGASTGSVKIDMDDGGDGVGTTQTVDLGKATGDVVLGREHNTATGEDTLMINNEVGGTLQLKKADIINLRFDSSGGKVITSDLPIPYLKQDLAVNISGDADNVEFEFNSPSALTDGGTPMYFGMANGAVMEIMNADGNVLSVVNSSGTNNIQLLNVAAGYATEVHYGGYDFDGSITAVTDFTLDLDADVSSHVFNVQVYADSTGNTMKIDDGELVWNNINYLRELTAVANLANTMNFTSSGGGVDIKGYTGQATFNNITNVKLNDVYSSTEIYYTAIGSEQFNISNGTALAQFFSSAGAINVETVYSSSIPLGTINLIDIAGGDFSKGAINANFQISSVPSTLGSLVVQSQDSTGAVVAGGSFVQNGNNLVINNHIRASFSSTTDTYFATATIGAINGAFDVIELNLATIAANNLDVFYTSNAVLGLTGGDVTAQYSIVDIDGVESSQLSVTNGSSVYNVNRATAGGLGVAVLDLQFETTSANITINSVGVYENVVLNMATDITLNQTFMAGVLDINAAGRDIGFRGADPNNIAGYANFVNPNGKDVTYTMYLDPAFTTTAGGTNAQVNTLNIDGYTTGTYILDGSSSAGFKNLDVNLLNTSGSVEVTLDSSGTDFTYEFLEGDFNIQMDDNTLAGNIQFGSTGDTFNMDFRGGVYMYNRYYGDDTDDLTTGNTHPSHEAKEIDMGEGFDTFNLGQFDSPTGASTPDAVPDGSYSMSVEFGVKREVLNSSGELDESTILMRLAGPGFTSFFFLSNVEELNIMDTQVDQLAFNYSYGKRAYSTGDLGGNFNKYRPTIEKFSFDGTLKLNTQGLNSNSMTTLLFLDSNQRVVSSQLDTGEVWTNIDFGQTKIENFLSTHTMSGDSTDNTQGRMILVGDLTAFSDYDIWVNDEIDSVFDVSFYMSPEIFGIDYKITASSTEVLIQDSSGSKTYITVGAHAGTLNYTELTYYTADFYRYNYMYAKETGKFMDTDAFFQDSKAQAVEVLYDLYSYDGGNLALFYTDVELYSRYMDEDVFDFIGVKQETIEDVFRYADNNDMDITKDGLEGVYNVYQTTGMKGILELVHDNTDGIKEFAEVTSYISKAVGQDIFEMAGINKAEYINHEYLSEAKANLDSDDVRVGLANLYNLVDDDEKFINIVNKISEFTDSDIFEFIGVSQEQFISAMQQTNGNKGEDSFVSLGDAESSNEGRESDASDSSRGASADSDSSSAHSHNGNETAQNNSNSQDSNQSQARPNTNEENNDNDDFAFDMGMIGDSVDKMSVMEHFEESMIGSLNDAATQNEHTLNQNHHNSSSNSSGGIG